MKLKCIGGLADSQLVEVDMTIFKRHDIIKVPAKITFEISTFEDDLLAFREGRTPESILTPYHYYKICLLQRLDIHKHKLDLYWLCPQNWDEWEAIIHLVRAH